MKFLKERPLWAKFGGDCLSSRTEEVSKLLNEKGFALMHHCHPLRREATSSVEAVGVAEVVVKTSATVVGVEMPRMAVVFVCDAPLGVDRHLLVQRTPTPV